LVDALSMYQAPAIVVVIVEGESEERFLRQVVTPYLSVRGVILKPQQMPTSQASKGGAINLDRLKNHAHKTLNKEKGCYLSTFFDLYALDASITSLSESPLSTDPLLRSTQIEQALAAFNSIYSALRVRRFIFLGRQSALQLQPKLESPHCTDSSCTR
jgi:Domain of unknown function (DUF4276)